MENNKVEVGQIRRGWITGALFEVIAKLMTNRWQVKYLEDEKGDWIRKGDEDSLSEDTILKCPFVRDKYEYFDKFPENVVDKTLQVEINGGWYGCFINETMTYWQAEIKMPNTTIPLVLSQTQFNTLCKRFRIEKKEVIKKVESVVTYYGSGDMNLVTKLNFLEEWYCKKVKLTAELVEE